MSDWRVSGGGNGQSRIGVMRRDGRVAHSTNVSLNIKADRPGSLRSYFKCSQFLFLLTFADSTSHFATMMYWLL